MIQESGIYHLKKIVIDTDFGHQIVHPYDGEQYYCPICAMPHGQHSAYGLNGSTNFDICPRCKAQFGLTDVKPDDAGDLTSEEHLNQLRIKWLDRTGWQQEDIDQLRQVLDIIAEDIRRK